jgi:anti-anti-sigma factor
VPSPIPPAAVARDADDVTRIGAWPPSEPRSELLEIVERRGERAVTVAARGELDISTGRSLQEAIDRALSADKRIEELILDLSELTFCDSTGLLLAIRATRATHSESIRFAITPPRNAAANRVFDLSGMGAVLPLDSWDPWRSDVTS